MIRRSLGNPTSPERLPDVKHRDVAMRVIDGGGGSGGGGSGGGGSGGGGSGGGSALRSDQHGEDSLEREPRDREPRDRDVSDEDRLVLERAARGDDAAVRQLYRAHVDRIHRTVSRILGGHDADVEDVVQQTFLAALDGAERFDGRSRVSTWLIGIATRRALDQSRDRWRRSRWQRVTEWVGLGRAAARPDDVHDSRSLAEWALAKLTPDQRTVFVLHEVEGHTLAEVSAMTGAGISTLHARLVAGRKRLDAALSSIGVETTSRFDGAVEGAADGGDDHGAA